MATLNYLGGYGMDSILNSIKKLLGITEECKDFNQDLIIHINSVFMILNQLGIGPKDGYKITGDANTWDEFILGDQNIESVKTYMCMKVKMMFDPPSSSIVADAINKQISELEWRLNATETINREGKN